MFEPEIETMPIRELRKLQVKRLREIVKYCYDNIPFYRKKFSQSPTTKVVGLSRERQG